MKHKKLIIAGVAVIVVIAAIFGLRARGNGDTETVAVRKGDLVKTVSVSGKVVAVDSADLAFARAGTVSRVYRQVGDAVRAGDVIAELSAGSARADLLKAQADLAAAEAEASKTGGSGASRQENASREAVQSIAAAFSAVDDAVTSKVDQFFDDPRTPNPRILFAFDDIALYNKINDERVTIEDILNKFTTTDVAKARQDVATVAAFLSDVARAVNDFDTNNTLDQGTIDRYRTDVAAARTEVNTALTNLISAENGLSDVSADAPVEDAHVASAQAAVARAQADLSDALIRAPFNGIVTRMDAKVGEAVGANTSLVSVKSGTYEIEAFVPEVSIAGLSVGNPAVVTLDAYGSGVEFTAKVSHVDPAETVKDGVSNYRIKLSFDKADDRIRSGMTANVRIETLRKPGVLLIPLRSVKDSGVLVKQAADGLPRVIETGATDSQGNVEVLSGLSEGEEILVDPVAQ
jgi:HlyD family secretion protein